MHKKSYVLMGDAGSPHLFKWYLALSRNFEVFVVSWHDSKDYVYENHISLSVGKLNPRGKWAYLYRLFKLILVIRKISPDFVNAHFLTSYGF
ncbi:glycosyltransferase [Aliamphritea spongicola]